MVDDTNLYFLPFLLHPVVIFFVLFANFFFSLTHLVTPEFDGPIKG